MLLLLSLPRLTSFIVSYHRSYFLVERGPSVLCVFVCARASVCVLNCHLTVECGEGIY